jgi:hypothetical protein
MITKTLKIAAAMGAALCLSMTAAQAQKIESLKVEPAKAEAGQPVKATTNFEVTGNAINCVVRLHWGDGQTQDFDVNQTKDVPLVLEHSYAKAGKFGLMVEGKGGKKCMGKDQTASVEITAKAVAAAAAVAPTASAAAALCPTGWKLVKGSAKKNGAFTCSAKAGTAIPEPKPTCPGNLTYFDNVKKGQLGCRV